MRGQSSFEAISLFATATIILSVFMIYFGSQISTQAEEREYLALRDVADTLRQEILIARQAGPGYTRSIVIPATSGEKEIIFSLEYSDDPNVSSELTVSFIPPLKDTIEASQILGPGVYGLFSGGENRIKVYDGGIVVEPDPGIMADLESNGLVDPVEAEIAFAYIEGPTVQLTDEIECEYALSNEWAIKGSQTWIDAGWIVHTPSGSSCHETSAGPGISYGDPVLFSDMTESQRSAFVKGTNISCIIRFAETGGGSPIDDVCDGYGSTLSDRVATSEPVTIVNSLPNIVVRDTTVARSSSGGGRTAWDIKLKVEVTDVDTDDDSFNVSVVQDGTNAAFIECDDQYDRCTGTGSGSFDLHFTYDAPWPEGEDCEAIDDLSFRIKAIESDSTSELYTLEPEDVSHALDCPEDPDA